MLIGFGWKPDFSEDFTRFSESHWKRTFGFRTKTRKRAHQRAVISPVSMQLRAIREDNANVSVLSLQNWKWLPSLFLQIISSFSFFGSKIPHKHLFSHKIEVFKIRIFCSAKNSKKLRGSSNYAGVNTIKTTLLSRQESTIYLSQLFHTAENYLKVYRV